MPSRTAVERVSGSEVPRWSLEQRLRGMIDWVRVCRQRARQRHQLATLDGRLLNDIGVSREEARDEAAKPFWVD